LLFAGLMTKATVVLGLVFALATGCGASGAGGKACIDGGKTYQPGARFTAQDGCNSCWCMSDGTVECTLAACLGDAGWTPPAGDASVADTAKDGALFDLAAAPEAGRTDVTAVDVGKDAAAGCEWGGETIPPGQSISDGCNTCVCSTSGTLACTKRACPAFDANAASCVLASALRFGYTGGLVAYEDVYTLDPATGMTIARTDYRGIADGDTVRTCRPSLPACGAPAVVSVSTIVQDLADADVQAALTAGSPQLYGFDQRPMDGAVWSIARAAGGTILVGAPCSSAGGAGCRAVPTGVQRLTDDLKSLATAMVSQSVCSAL
jgi:Pacifastin inhibitor (LCMII)